MARFAKPICSCALAWPWLFIWQGLDFTDQGYLLTNYRCFFRHPEATADSGNMWLTNLVGASWDALFGSLGVVGMRALWALCMSFCLLLAFRMTRALTNEPVAAGSVWVASVFLSDRHATWFSYNAFSTLLLSAAAACLLHGIRQRNVRTLFAAGLIVGLAPFARFPNVLGLALISALGMAAWIEPERRRQLPRDLAFTSLGIVTAIAGMAAAIYLRGDADLYVHGVTRLFEPSLGGDTHTLHSLFGLFVKDQLLAVAWGLGVCLGAAVLVRALHAKPAVAPWLLPLACALGVFVLTHKSDSWRWAVPGTCYLVLGGVALGAWKRSAELRVAAFLLLVLVVIAPLGSDRGIKNAHMGLWLALPFLLALVYTLDRNWLYGQGARLALVAGVVLTGEALYQTATYTYRDSARIRLRSAVDHPQLRAQYTTPERAKAVGQVLAALAERVAPDDYLLAYEGTPLLQYLTRTRPYLNRPWLMGWEDGRVIAQLAADAPERTGCLPVAVVTTKSARGAEWPQHAQELEPDEPQRGERSALTAFLHERGYTRTWSNGYFEILEPPLPERGHCR
jgi:hypothetical protein